MQDIKKRVNSILGRNITYQAGALPSQPDYSGPSRDKRQLGRHTSSSGWAGIPAPRLGRFRCSPAWAGASSARLGLLAGYRGWAWCPGWASSRIPAGPAGLLRIPACLLPRLGSLRPASRLGLVPRLGLLADSPRLGRIRRIRPGRESSPGCSRSTPAGPDCVIPAGPGWCFPGPGRIIFIIGRDMHSQAGLLLL
jgi:hypothetical protein